MQNYQSHPKSSMGPFVWIIATAVVMIAGFIGVLAFTGHQSNSSGSQAGPGQIGNSGGNNTGGNASDCSTSGGPCIGLNDGTAGCANSGPCTQNSSGQVIIPGKVVAVSSTSITIKPTAGGNNQTFAITADTKENKGGGSANSTFNAGDISVGSGVAIIPSSTNNSQAELVMLNFQSQMESGSGGAAAH